LSELLTGELAAITDDLVLMVSEAVTNAIRHSDSGKLDRGGNPGTVTIVVLDSGCTIRVEVNDAGSARSVPHLADDGPDALNGRGLHMLDTLCAGRWGSYHAENGRTLWFEVQQPS
jgi:anti-sigma regulatory factor (Ser/Thr protein kinase)